MSELRPSGVFGTKAVKEASPINKQGLLPGLDRIVIPEGKIKYSMAEDENKAFLWGHLLGYTYETDGASVRRQILSGIRKYQCEYEKTDVYGNRYFVVLLMITTKGGEHEVLTGWIDDASVNQTRLTTLMPVTEKIKNRKAVKLK
jgi:hypothetical protein